MTNEEIKEAIYDLQISTPAKPMTLAEFDRYMYIICEVIDVLKQTRWIPVSERLPEEGRRVLVTDKFEAVTTAIYFRKSPFWREMVVSWMPLPERYKGGEEE